MSEERRFILACLTIIAVASCLMVGTVAVRDVYIAQIKCEAIK
jgi:hypothetical protein